MREPLVVWLGDRRIGTLRPAGANVSEFHPEDRSTLLAVGTPNDRSAWPAEFTRNWFENLLPEEEPRARIAARFGLRADDTWGLLERIGWECAGAVSVLPDGRSPFDGSYQPIDEAGVWARIDDLPARLHDPDNAVRSSLAGRQPKLPLASIEGRWFLPIDGAPSTHILKPEPAHLAGMAVAEAWALRLAGAATPAAEARVMIADGHAPTLVVTRFDRHIGPDGSISRRHQEDMCQVLGIPAGTRQPGEARKGTQPSYHRFSQVLARRAHDPAAEMVRLIEQMTVNVAIGNVDMHAKNVSLVADETGAVRMAPLYDIVPMLDYSPQGQSGLAVAGNSTLTEITRETLVLEATSWGVSQSVARETVNGAVAAMSWAVPDIDRLFPTLRRDVRRSALDQLDRLARP